MVRVLESVMGSGAEVHGSIHTPLKLHREFATGQLVAVKHCRQLPVITSHKGVEPPHWELFAHWNFTQTLSSHTFPTLQSEFVRHIAHLLVLGSHLGTAVGQSLSTVHSGGFGIGGFILKPRIATITIMIIMAMMIIIITINAILF